MKIIITANHGRIGPFWWVNSKTFPAMFGPFRVINWGTYGVGRRVRIVHEVLP